MRVCLCLCRFAYFDFLPPLVQWVETLGKRKRTSGFFLFFSSSFLALVTYNFGERWQFNQEASPSANVIADGSALPASLCTFPF